MGMENQRSPRGEALPRRGERSSRLDQFLNRGRLLGAQLDVGIREHQPPRCLKVVAVEQGYRLVPITTRMTLPFYFRTKRFANQAAIELEKLFDWHSLQPICGDAMEEVERIARSALQREDIDRHWADRQRPVTTV